MRGQFAAIHRRARESEARRKEYETRGDKPRGPMQVYFKSGEQVTLWFTGRLYARGEIHSEPHGIMQHYAAGLNYFNCAGPACVVCQAIQGGHKKLPKASPRYVFNVIEQAPTHILKRQGHKNDWIRCTQDRTCRPCQNPGPQDELRAGGRKVLTLAQRHADALGAVDEELSSNCAACKRGRVKVDDYICPNPRCGELFERWAPDPMEPEARVVCGACRQNVVPREELSCSTQGCTQPRRATIFSLGCAVRCRRNGDGNGTTFSFFPEWPPGPPPKEAREPENAPYNLVQCFDASKEDQARIAQVLQIATGAPGGNAPPPDFAAYDQDQDVPF